MLTVNFTKLTLSAIQPTYATDGSVGLDLYALEDTWLLQGLVTVVSTGLAIELPPGYEAQIRPRSSMGLQGIMIPNSPATIDTDYRGEIRVALMPMIDSCFVAKGDRIAQMVIAAVPRVQLTQVDVLTPTDRGSQGWGGSGR